MTRVCAPIRSPRYIYIHGCHRAICNTKTTKSFASSASGARCIRNADSKSHLTMRCVICSWISIARIANNADAERSTPSSTERIERVERVERRGYVYFRSRDSRIWSSGNKKIASRRIATRAMIIRSVHCLLVRICLFCWFTPGHIFEQYDLSIVHKRTAVTMLHIWLRIRATYAQLTERR